MVSGNWDFEELYREIPKQVVVKETPSFSPENIVGCDVSYRRKARVTCVVFNIRERSILEEVTLKRDIPADYLPSKFAKREMPLIGEAISKISGGVDCILVDGHGIAHPGRAGLACFADVLLGFPTIGCAKNLLVGNFEDINFKRGNWSSIFYKGQKVGEAICTKNGTTPIFISPGNKIGFKNARDIILSLAINSKYPEPLRVADLNTRRCF